jgi:magnesium-transporting ATPase (P-type)
MHSVHAYLTINQYATFHTTDAGVWSKKHSGGAWYLDATGSNITVAFNSFFTWFILLSGMVPISLLVSAEMVKFIMSAFIENDIDMYYDKIDKPTKCNTSTIHEDLGVLDCT